MLVGILVAVLIPLLAGLALWFTDWAESAMVAPIAQPALPPRATLGTSD